MLWAGLKTVGIEWDRRKFTLKLVRFSNCLGNDAVEMTL